MGEQVPLRRSPLSAAERQALLDRVSDLAEDEAMQLALDVQREVRADRSGKRNEL